MAEINARSKTSDTLGHLVEHERETVPEPLDQQSHVTPQLPSEVWHEILTLATFVPGFMDTHARDWFGSPAPLEDSVLFLSGQVAMKTKRSIVLVCKVWNALATPFLYETARLRTLKGTKALLNTLESPCRWRGNPGSQGELAIKRLDIAYFLCRRRHIKHELYGELVGRLLSLLRCLEILVIWDIGLYHWSEKARYSFCEAVSCSLSSKTLRKLDISQVAISGEYFKRLINSQPLRVLRLPCSQPCVEYNLNSGIESINIIPGVLSSISHLDPLTTSLSCILDINHLPWAWADREAPQITCLEARNLHSLQESRHMNIFFSILSACKRLQTLIAEPEAFFNVIQTISKLPPIKALGLNVVQSRGCPIYLWEFLNKKLPMLPMLVPSIQQIRMFDDDCKTCVPDNGTLRLAAELSSSLLTSYGISLEDKYGKPYHKYMAEDGERTVGGSG